MSDAQWQGVSLPWGDSISSFIDAKTDRDILKTSIIWILFTRPGERVMLPTFGAGVQESVFEPNDEQEREGLKLRIENAVKTWDDRIEIIDLDLAQQDEIIQVTIVFRNVEDPVPDNWETLAFAIKPTMEVVTTAS